jgi:protein-L-isoaspartate(D-aspartate) O-methyltransferase
MGEKVMLTQQELVNQLAPYIQSERLREAFLHVPRHRFLSAFYEKIPNAEKKALWKYVQRSDMDEQAWCKTIYQDAWFVTRLDSHSFPASSSSQPSIMAEMLETLAVQPGQRVLEIGTGTGYNAALIAYLTGDPTLVTTIDVDEGLVEQARPIIKHCVGSGMSVVAGDGLQGFAANAPYDRIIATGSSPYVPQPWIDQLTPGGLLVMNLKSTLANVMLLIRKQDDETALGTILPYGGNFMGLHNGTGAYHSPSLPLGPLKHVISPLPERSSFYPQALENLDFRFLLYCHFPEMLRHRIWKNKTDLFIYLADYRSKHLVQFYANTVRGSSHLWLQLQEIAQEWLASGQPKGQDYTMHIERGQHSMHLGDRRWVISDASSSQSALSATRN